MGQSDWKILTQASVKDDCQIVCLEDQEEYQTLMLAGVVGLQISEAHHRPWLNLLSRRSIKPLWAWLTSSFKSRTWLTAQSIKSWVEVMTDLAASQTLKHDNPSSNLGPPWPRGPSILRPPPGTEGPQTSFHLLVGLTVLQTWSQPLVDHVDPQNLRFPPSWLCCPSNLIPATDWPWGPQPHSKFPL